jgi:hypothetical protein
MKPKSTLRLLLPASLLMAGLSNAATLVAIDDTTLLKNGDFERDKNFGGRPFVIIGNNGDSVISPRYGIFRFDISTIASQITAGTDIQSATLTLTEHMASDATHGTTTRTFSVHGITAANAGWVEGTSNGTLEAGTVSLSYLNTGANNAASTDWASGAGNGPTATDLFTFGTDTGAAIGSNSVTFATGSQQTLVIGLDTAALKNLLAQWQTSNSGLALQATGNGQTSWDSNETGVGGVPAKLDITFVPEPSTALLGALGMLALLRRRRA